MSQRKTLKLIMIEEIAGWDEAIEKLYCKGHIDKDLFIEHLMKYDYTLMDYDINKIHYDVWRFIPDKSGNFNCKLIQAELGKQGAFAVTYIEVE